MTRDERIDWWMDRFVADVRVQEEAVATVGAWLEARDLSVEARAFVDAWQSGETSGYYERLGRAAANLLDRALLDEALVYAIDMADDESVCRVD